MKFKYWLLCFTISFFACQPNEPNDNDSTLPSTKKETIKKKIRDVLKEASSIPEKDSLIDFILEASQSLESQDKVVLFQQTLEKIKPHQSPSVEKLYLHLAYWLNDQSKYYQALPYYERVLDYHEQTPLYTEPEIAAEHIYKVLANIYNRIGEKDKAKYLLEKALKNIADLKETLDIRKMKARFYLDLSRVYPEQKAEDILHQGTTLFSEAEKKDPSVKFHLGLLYIGLADIQNTQNDIKQAEISAKLAIKYLEDPYYYAAALTVLGNVYAQQGKNAEAIALLLQATQLVDSNTRERGKVFLDLAQIYLDEKNYKLALENSQRALKEVLPIVDTVSVYNNPQAAQFYPENTIWEALMLKAKAFHQLYDAQKQPKDLQGAEDNYGLAQKIFTLMRDNLNYDTSKVIIAHQSQEMFQGMCELAHTFWEKRDKAKASEWIYYATENNKAVLLRQKLAADEALNRSSLGKEQQKMQGQFFAMQEQRAVLLNEIHDLSFAKDLDPKELRLAKLRLGSLDNRFYTLKNKLKNEMASLQMRDILPLEMLQKTLKNGTVVASYAYFPELDRQHFFAFSLSKDGLIGFVKGKMPTQTLNEFLKSVGNKNSALNLRLPHYENQAKYLYNQLLSPLLPAEKKPERLVIVPDGKLAQLPFEILIDPRAKRRSDDFAGLGYVLQDTYVSYRPALSLYDFSRTIKTTYKIQPYLAMIPDYHYTQSFDTLSSAASKEIHKIETMWKGKSLQSSEATKAAFTQQAKFHGILHFFGHALAALEDNSFSWLAFSPLKKPGAVATEKRSAQGSDSLMGSNAVHPDDEDCLLYAHMIANLKLNAELVCLTGCETGLGQNIPGEGAISLAWAFQQAGCPSTAMSLWKLIDLEASQLSLNFFTYLHRGFPKDEALTLAKRDYLTKNRDKGNPYYWGGLVLLGNQDPISTRDAWYKRWMN